jgi:hypothetical protein
VGHPTAKAPAGGGVTRVACVAAALCALALLGPVGASGAQSVRAEVSPSRTRVGRPFDYIVRATLDSGDDAGRATIVAPVGPFEAVGPATTARDGREVRLTQRLACLSAGCVPGRDPRVVSLPAPRVVVGGRATTTAQPASIAVVPLVPAAVVAARDAKYRRQTEIPAPRFSPDPGLLSGVAAGLALALVIGAAILVATGLRRRAGASTAETDAYDRAVRLLRESAGRPAPDRRRAAGLLGRVARARAGEGLAVTAERVAWSRPKPDAAAVGGLADCAETERT